MILVIDAQGRRLCQDGRFRGFASFGSFAECVHTYRRLGAAKRRIRRYIGAVVVRIPAGMEVNAAGQVLERVPLPNSQYEAIKHHKLREFVVS